MIQRTFDLGLMTRIAVGPAWTQFTADQQQRLTEAFIRYTVSQYANRFDGFSGERFEVDPGIQPNANGVIVQTRLVKSNGEVVTLNYLMRRGASGAWQVIDVYLKGTISELATRRSEFSGVLQSFRRRRPRPASRPALRGATDGLSGEAALRRNLRSARAPVGPPRRAPIGPLPGGETDAAGTGGFLAGTAAGAGGGAPAGLPGSA